MEATRCARPSSPWLPPPWPRGSVMASRASRASHKSAGVLATSNICRRRATSRTSAERVVSTSGGDLCVWLCPPARFACMGRARLPCLAWCAMVVWCGRTAQQRRVSYLPREKGAAYLSVQAILGNQSSQERRNRGVPRLHSAPSGTSRFFLWRGRHRACRCLPRKAKKKRRR